MPLSATADGSVSAGTCSLTEDCQAGPNSAMPLPTMKHSASSDVRRDQVEPRQHRQRGRAGQRDRERDQRHDAPVVHVGDGAGRHRDQHDRQHQRGLHQRDLVGGRRHLRHRPGGADALDQDAEVGDQAGEPDAPEHRMPQRRRDAVGAKRFGCSVISGSVGLLSPAMIPAG